MDAKFYPSDKKGAEFPYFPAPEFAVIWRNWGLASVSDIAAALDSDEATVNKWALKMGLTPKTVLPRWRERGFLTIIRNNWNLCEYDQIMRLTGMDEKQLEFTLLEDDFMWVKMGNLKPAVERPTLKAEYPKNILARLDEIAEIISKYPLPAENAFEFLDDYLAEYSGDIVFPQQDKIRLMYSYFGLYADTLADDAFGSYPDRLLAEYAKNGINAIWFQTLLSQLVPNPWEDSTAAEEKRKKRLSSLRALIKRAAKYGIGVYLYINEPRPMSDAFFEKFPHLEGASFDIYKCLCTSLPEVQKYLEDSMEYLFREAEGLAGYFNISCSENFTNCASRGTEAQATCPRCKNVPPENIIAIVNNCLERGAKKGNPKAKAIAHVWSWNKDWSDRAIEKLNDSHYVLAVSERRIKFKRGGIDAVESDYSMSVVGPGEESMAVWNSAIKNGKKPMAKIQINASWEISSQPYLPVFSLIGEHIEGIKKFGVRDTMLTWTVGGSPSPVTEFACSFLDSDKPLDSALFEFFREKYGAAADTVMAADKQFCKAFLEYPFNISVIYKGPQTMGPITPFWLEPTGCLATMVGFHYDDIDSYRGCYPREILEQQFRIMTDEWKKGIEILESQSNNSDIYKELLLMAKAAHCHFASAYNHIKFINCREVEDTCGMLEAVCSEREAVKELIKIRGADSRIGFEASNHYYYSVQDLAEKLINLDYVENILKA